MKNSLFLFIILFSFPTYAQVWQWGRQAGNDSTSNSSHSVITDKYGNVYIAGYFEGASIFFGIDTIYNSNWPISGLENTLFLVKYDAMGNVLWVKSSGNSGSAATSLATDTFGNIYMTGYYQSTQLILGNDTLSKGNFTYGTAMFVAKYDKDGNVIWARSSHSIDTSFDYAASVIVDNKGNVCVTGTFVSYGLIFGNDTLINLAPSGGDMFIVKYDASGNTIWAKQSVDGISCIGSSIVADTSGNMYVGGANEGDIDNPLIFGSDTIREVGIHSFLVKYDTLGNLQWAKSLTGSSRDNIYSVATDLTGNIIIGGYFIGNLILGSDTLFDVPSGGDVNLFLAKYNQSGNIIWTKSVAGKSIAYSIATDDSGYIYTTGVFGASTVGNVLIINADTLTSLGGDDILIIKFDSNGIAKWAVNTGGRGDDDAYGITTDIRGNNIYVTGNFNSRSFLFGGDNMECLDTVNEQNIFLAKLNPLIRTGINPTQIMPDNISIYPNPVATLLTIKSLDNPIEKIAIINLTGQTIYTHEYNSKEVQVNIGYLPTGLFFMRVNDTEAFKFMKE